MWSLILSSAMMLTMTVNASAQTNITESFNCSSLKGYVNDSEVSNSYCWVEAAANRVMEIRYDTGVSSTLWVKNAELNLGLVDNSGWKYDSSQTYVAEVTCPEAGSNVLKQTFADGKASFNVTDMLKNAVSNGQISFRVAQSTDGLKFTFHKDSKADKLTITYYTESEFVEEFNSNAKAENIDEYINAFTTSTYLTDYNRIKNTDAKTQIAATVLSGKPYKTLSAAGKALDAAVAEYLKNPSYEDKSGKTVSYTAEYARAVQNESDAIKKDYAYLGSFNISGTNEGLIYALLKFNVKDVNFDFVRKATITYDTLDTFVTWYNRYAPGDYRTRVDAVTSEWVTGESTYASLYGTGGSSTVEKGVATAYIADTYETGRTYTKDNVKYNLVSAKMYADVTDNLKSRTDIDSDGNVSYRLSKAVVSEIEQSSYMVTKDTVFTLNIEYLNDSELLERIAAASTTEEFDNIVNSGVLDYDIIKKYNKLNNKSTVASNVMGKTYAGMDDFVSAFENAYNAYIQNPSFEDEAGITKALSNIEYAKVDNAWKASVDGDANKHYSDLINDYANMGMYNSNPGNGELIGAVNALLKFNISGINTDYVKKAELKYNVLPSFSNWYTYNPEGDYTTQIDAATSEWTNTSTYADYKANNTFEENVAEAYAEDKGTYAVMTADVTDSFKSSRADENGNISYRLSKKSQNGSNADNINFYVISKDCSYSIEIEYINDYELFKKYNEVKSNREALGEFIYNLAKIKEIKYNETVALIEIYGTDYSSLAELETAIANAGKNGSMKISDVTVTPSDTGFTGSFTVYNFAEENPDEDIYSDLANIVVASYTQDNEMIESYIVTDGGVADIEVPRTYYNDNGDPVVGVKSTLSFTLTKNENVDNIKVYVWDGFKTMKPYCKAEKIYSK